MAMAVLVAVILSFYWPLSELLFGRVLMPLRSPSGVVVVNRMVRPGAVRRGETIAYQIQGWVGTRGHAGIYVGAGLGLGRVLAVAGDRVEFGSEHFLVNGVAFPLQADMPKVGELVVREGHWFIWPSVARWRGAAGAGAMTATLMRVASVPQSDFIGKPFKRWFGRWQPLL